ncbi:MAG TPA: tRNA uridine-5-carboxymethylaminomethyl(34) synthesis GTPase MnmE [Pyrinomonadaceae bacterium]
MSTIVALSTPVGRGAISVVRLSGDKSLVIARLLAPQLDNVKARYATLAQLRYPETGEVLDEVVITYFQGPHSVTGEDVVEISCHGSPAIVRQILDQTINLGARLADPGEFSLRALRNGKIDLAQAEAIRDLIAAETEAAVKQASRQVGGELAHTLSLFESDLTKVMVLLESALEFVEDDLPPNQVESVVQLLTSTVTGVEKLANSYSAGRLLQHGVNVAIVGSPNVGKSSLFNRLVEQDRAIVTHIPGTTRDTLSHAIDIGGIPVVLVDTAGMRETDDTVESIGIERTRRAMTDADLVLQVVDGSEPDAAFLDEISTASILVLNKSDLGPSVVSIKDARSVRVSALTGEGLDELRAAILASLNRGDSSYEGLLITNARQFDLLSLASMAIREALGLLGDRASEELVLVPLHNALRYLGQITGETTSEEILGQIFATFCIGK